MMDRNYPSSSFADALAAPPQTVASWAYERGSAAIKPSPNYVTPHLDGELLQQQSYTTTQQLPTYTTAHIPAAARTLESTNNNPVTSIMSFLSAMESRSLQAGPVSASLLPPFRPPSWTTGANSSTTELYLSGALPSTASFPSPAVLSSFQHTDAYTSRSYATNTSLTLPDPAFSTSTNGLFSHHDPLRHLKPSQAVLSSALAFNHLSAPSLGSALPVQSSTYRSAQESAPHLLQPQFGLLPSALPTPHGAPQPYGATVFTDSIDRALQRECSVIKHHQRPSSSHMATEHMPNSENSLQGYFGSGSETDTSYQQDPSRHTPVSCSPSSRTDSTQGVSGSPQPKSDCGTQPYSSNSLLKSEDGSSRLNSHSAGDEEIHTQNLRTGSPERYPSPAQKQNSVIANQQAVQISGLMSDSLSQSFMAPQTQSQASHSPSEKLSSLYTTLPSHSSHCDNVAAVSQTLIYTSTAGLSPEQIQYGTQVQRFCEEAFSESYPNAPNLTFTSQPQEQASATHSQSYNTGQPLNSVFQSTCVQSLSTSNSMVDYSLMQESVGGKAHSTVSHQQTQSHSVLSIPLPTYSSPAQPIQNHIRSSKQETEPTYVKQKIEELPPQDIEALQQVSMVSVADNSMASHNNVIHVVSKLADHKPQSVIRSNSRSDEQFLVLGHASLAQVKNGHVGAMTQRQVCLGSVNGHEVANSVASNTSVSSHGPLTSEQLNQQLRSPEQHQQNQQTHTESQSQIPAAHSQFMPVPTSQVLLEPNQMILVQQPLIHQSQNTSKLVSVQGVQPVQCLAPVHVQYLHMDRGLLCTSVANENQSQQTIVRSEPSSECSSSSKHHYSQTASQQPNDDKNQYALNSICFPDSMLLEDDRNILSNVDDILAATVAACGVTPQDFVKATSSAEAEMTSMASPVDSKGHLLTVDISQMSPSFSSSQHPAVTNTHSHMTMSMTHNGVQMATNLALNGDGMTSGRQVFNSPVPTLPGPLLPQESPGVSSHQKPLEEDLHKNLETLPSFSSDEEESTGKNQALRNSISSALSALDETSDRKMSTDNQIQVSVMKPVQLPTIPLTITQIYLPPVPAPVPVAPVPTTVSAGKEFVTKEKLKEMPSGQLAMQLMSVALEGLTDEEPSDSGGEGMYRERDEFVVRNEDIETFKVTMRAGVEPPAIWKVQKALLQKFVPELKDAKRVFSATNSYLGYFGDAKTMYKRVYVKFLETVNKREYVRVCSRKPRSKPMSSLKAIQMKALLGLTDPPSSASQNQKPRPKQVKPRAEPPPKKRKKWKEEFLSTPTGTSAEEELNPPLASRLLNTRTMKETFKSFVELLISVALDEDVLITLERANDELLLPHMKKVDGMITDIRKRLLNKLHIGQVLKTALDSFPEISVVTELKKDGETPAFKVRLSGKAYNKKTMKPYKMPNKVPQEFTVDQQKTQWFSLYHSLQHYKYHTYLMCKDEIASLRVQVGNLGQEETIHKCLQNGAWVEGLFDRFGELISQVRQKEEGGEICRRSPEDEL
ncbi:hypothetical protein ILYODFUR_016611 [Ilyodon furcidens]|uniref:DUF4211 domain-containing protein n=1 Tax=Ilyodon furcidens TaxID=33524 RepID=A0ABV0SLQ8_9TELE